MCVLEGVFVALWHALGLMVITRTRGPALYRRTRESHLYNPPPVESQQGARYCFTNPCSFTVRAGTYLKHLNTNAYPKHSLTYTMATFLKETYNTIHYSKSRVLTSI